MIVRRHTPARLARRGFTLVEVLAVITIILILAGLATVSVQAAMSRARVNEARVKAQSIIKAADLHYTTTSQIPSIEQLINRTEDGPPLLNGGLAAITDPWGNLFNLEYVQSDAAGASRFVVTTTGPDSQVIREPKQ